MRNSVGPIKIQQNIQIHKHSYNNCTNKTQRQQKQPKLSASNDSAPCYLFTIPNEILIQKEGTVFREHLQSVKLRFVSKH